MYSVEVPAESKSMSRLDEIVQAPGILAVTAGKLDSFEYRFSEGAMPADYDRWRQLFAGLARVMLMQSDVNEARLVLQDYTLLLRYSEDVIVGVVALKGHPVVKSMQRMVRSTFRHLGVKPPETRSRYAPRATPAPVAPTAKPYTGDDDVLWKKPQ